jgi:hypothetical protein
VAPGKTVVWSAGGTGTALRSCTRYDDEGVFDATKWVTVVYLPVLPLRRDRYRLVERRNIFPGWRALLVEHVAPLELVGVARTYVLAWVLAPAAFFVPLGVLGLPGVVLGRFDVAAVGAVLSSLWMIPFAVGTLFWTLNQPWPQTPPRRSWTAFIVELRRSAPILGGSVAAAFVILGGGCGGVRVIVDLVAGLDLPRALLGGMENAAFFLVLCAVLGPVVWMVGAWRAAQLR